MYLNKDRLAQHVVKYDDQGILGGGQDLMLVSIFTFSSTFPTFSGWES